MTPDEIIKGMQKKNLLLSQKNDEYKELIEKEAGLRNEYRKAFAKKILELRAEGQPGSIVTKIAQGDPNISKLEFDCDIAKGIKDACRESINDIRIAIDTYRSILTWMREEMHQS